MEKLKELLAFYELDKYLGDLMTMGVFSIEALCKLKSEDIEEILGSRDHEDYDKFTNLIDILVKRYKTYEFDKKSNSIFTKSVNKKSFSENINLIWNYKLGKKRNDAEEKKTVENKKNEIEVTQTDVEKSDEPVQMDAKLINANPKEANPTDDNPSEENHVAEEKNIEKNEVISNVDRIHWDTKVNGQGFKYAWFVAYIGMPFSALFSVTSLLGQLGSYYSNGFIMFLLGASAVLSVIASSGLFRFKHYAYTCLILNYAVGFVSGIIFIFLQIITYDGYYRLYGYFPGGSIISTCITLVVPFICWVYFNNRKEAFNK